jgi:hypothetical protein
VPSGRARRHAASSSVAPVSSGYERSLRPSSALAERTRTAKHHPEGSPLIRLVVLVVLALAAASDAVACTCASAPARVRLDSADAAFVGRLVESRPSAAVDGAAELRHTFLVDGVVKGELPRRVEVLSPAGGAACGFELPRDEATGILLRRRGDAWTGGLCGQIAVGELLEASEERDERLVNWGGIVVGSLVLALGAWLLWRRLRARRAAIGSG